jgi:signal peptidase I
VLRPKTLLDWAAAVCAALVVVLIFEAKVAKPYRIPSSSMEPTLHCARPADWCEARFSDRVIVNRLAYLFGSPRRGQVVVFTAPENAAARCGQSGTYVKRLIGLPGDLVEETRGRVRVNGNPIDEPYVDPKLRDDLTGSWRVPRGRYFLLGDDRAHSCDSRTWGSVRRSALIGPVLFTYWPPNRLSLH